MLTKNSKVECSSDDTILQLETFIKSTYPSAIFNFLSSDQYYKDPYKNRITIKIGIAGYHAAFGTDIKTGIGNIGGNFSYGIFANSKWNAITAYSVKLYDYRNGKEDKKTKDILKTGSASNLLGYSSAKKILNTTYMEANQDMLFFIDEALMK